MDSPFCKYCKQIYSNINEPIYIVCLCEEKLTYAHRSCFRDWLKQHKYGVCESCLTKTRIISDGFKPLKQVKLPSTNKKVVLSTLSVVLWFVALLGFLLWMLIDQCWQAYCIVVISLFLVFLILSFISCCAVKTTREFWEEFMVVNRYWKIVYCRETKVGKKTVRRYSDVPHKIPWESPPGSVYNDNLSDVGVDHQTEHDGNKDTDRRDPNEEESGTSFPSIWTPREYPYVKRNPVYSKDTLERNKINSIRHSSFKDTLNRDQRFSTRYPQNDQNNGISAGKNDASISYFKDEYIDHDNNIIINMTFERNDYIDGKDAKNNVISGDNEGSEHSEDKASDSESDDNNTVLNTRGEKVVDTKAAVTKDDDELIDTIVREGNKELSYIDSRADSFYKPNSYKGIDIEELRNNLKSHRRQYAVSQYNLNRHYSNAGYGKFDAIQRARSEPNVSNSKNRGRFSKYFKDDDGSDDGDVNSKKRASSNLSINGPFGKLKGLIRNASKKESKHEVLMPNSQDVVYRALNADSSLAQGDFDHDREGFRNNLGPSNGPHSLQGSLSMPSHANYPEQPNLFEKRFNLFTSNFHESFTPEPTRNEKASSKNLSKEDGSRQEENVNTDVANPEEIHRILSTPLHELDVSELFDVDAPTVKKQRASLFQGDDKTSLFYAPS